MEPSQLIKMITPYLKTAFTFKVKKIGIHTMEVAPAHNIGVHEKPYSCHNRVWRWEPLPRYYKNRFAELEYPACVNNVEDICRYLISRIKTPSSAATQTGSDFVSLQRS